MEASNQTLDHYNSVILTVLLAYVNISINQAKSVLILHLGLPNMLR
jgi:hypothetical protein